MNEARYASASAEPNKRIPPKPDRDGRHARLKELLIPAKNHNARMAFYLGMLAAIPGFALLLGPTAMIVGWGSLKQIEQHPELDGKSHALFGFWLGLAFTALNVAAIVFLAFLLPPTR